MGIGSRKPVYGDAQTTLLIRAVCLALAFFAVGKISRKRVYITIEGSLCSLASGFRYELVKKSVKAVPFFVASQSRRNV